ncbi:MAG: hypothetical protein DCC68_21995 [Planctomycetota bacterium]|nr:MAG: hypothetical protein DCC68_21995 [Planctomycetota bacterium]
MVVVTYALPLGEGGRDAVDKLLRIAPQEDSSEVVIGMMTRFLRLDECLGDILQLFRNRHRWSRRMQKNRKAAAGIPFGNGLHVTVSERATDKISYLLLCRE